MLQTARDLLLARLDTPLQLVDVGARWGVNPIWAPLGDKARILGFEPEPEECARLNAARPPNVEYLPIGLADSRGTRTLHLTREPACSSVYPPVPKLVEHFACLDIITEERTLEFPCLTLDEAMEQQGIGAVAAIKLDTQGSELDILRGAERTLEHCHLVDVEVEFNPIYSGQNLFCDLDHFMRDRGFVIWRLENLSHYAPEHVPAADVGFFVSADPGPTASMVVANGQLFWAQARYVRAGYPITGADHIAMEQAIPAALLASLYGFWDLSLELVRKTGDADLHATLRQTLQMPV